MTLRATYLTLLATFLAATLGAQTLEMSVNRKALALNEYLQLELALHGARADIQLPDLDAFRVVQGPSVGFEQSTVNGQTSITYRQTYTLVPVKPGTFELPAAKVKLPGGKVLTSNRVKVEVVQNSREADRINAKGDVTLQIQTEKSTVYVGEPLWASYNLYAAVKTQQHQFDIPDVDGFYVEELEADNRLRVKNVNGRNMETAEVRRQLLFPQRAGEIRLEPFTMRAVKVEGSMFRRKTTPVSASSNARIVTVRPLPPGKPDGFVGTYLDYDLKVDVSTTSVAANEAIDITVTVSGKGNLRLVSPPEFDWPLDFEVLDPTPKDNIQINRYSESGSRKFSYVVIPRSAGTFEIPGISQSWFDPKKESYQTVRTEPMRFEVSEAVGGSSPVYTDGETVNRRDVQTLNQDIRYIRTTTDGFGGLQSLFFGSVGFWGVLALPFVLLGGFAVWKKRREEANSGTPDARRKQAARVARKYLKQAEAAVDGNKDAFFEALSRSLFGYLADKLSIPLSEFNRDTLESLLRGKLPDDQTSSVLELVDRCQEARYSPIASLSPREALEQTASVIQNLENA